MSDPSRQPRFCHQCGAALPPAPARFCIECGAPIRGIAAPVEPELPPAPLAREAGAPTIKLANANVPQQVIGGTVKLPASGAVPPGLWVLNTPPGPEDVVAIYPPLRPVRGGWSGLIGRGWQAAGSRARGSQTIFRFQAEVTWFPAPDCGDGLRLVAQVSASSRAWEGRARRGFRFGVSRDGPMTIVSAVWQDANGHEQHELPLPQIQIMAPPRVPRVSDFDESPALLNAREANLWARDSQATGAYRPWRDQLVQEHTLVGRGIALIPLSEGPRAWIGRIIEKVVYDRYRAKVLQPFTCSLAEWKKQLKLIGNEARALGLDLDPALAAEWWLDRNGYDGVIFTKAHARYKVDRVLIVFRRSQLAKIKD
ncbi:MAG: zinc ribbon domain-containing protein [Candidatus Viridilinea halotolerans]|uniref:Zinc ribbon domain-containing protein n=1 Tax=Candidatus Viridilinea halotolerans TaxID=2491704 RepID=A0A426TXE2_9CHLR|nr:MAG: zinc ribbon domain-containing protein [Candidatus Viridilinea halotolerans]